MPSSLQEAGVHARMQGIQVQDRKEVDCLKLPIEGRWATYLCPHRQVRTQQSWDLVACRPWGYQGHCEGGLRCGSHLGVHQVLPHGPIDRCTMRRVLRG